MSAIAHLDHRLALLLLCVLFLGAAAALAAAWARVLPEDKPPLAPMGRDPSRRTRLFLHEPPPPRRDWFALILLIFVTLSYATQFPGVSRDSGFGALSWLFPSSTGPWLELTLVAIFVLTPGIAAAYSVIRPNPLRIPLLCAGILVLLLWLLAPPLYAALMA